MFFMFGGSFSQGQTSRLWSTSSYPWMSKDSASKDIEINSANASKASKAVVSCWLEGLYFDVIIWLDCAINATACRRGHSIHPPCWSDGVAGLSLRRFPVVPCGPCIPMLPWVFILPALLSQKGNGSHGHGMIVMRLSQTFTLARKENSWTYSFTWGHVFCKSTERRKVSIMHICCSTRVPLVARVTRRDTEPWLVLFACLCTPMVKVSEMLHCKDITDFTCKLCLYIAFACFYKKSLIVLCFLRCESIEFFQTFQWGLCKNVWTPLVQSLAQLLRVELQLEKQRRPEVMPQAIHHMTRPRLVLTHSEDHPISMKYLWNIREYLWNIHEFLDSFWLVASGVNGLRFVDSTDSLDRCWAGALVMFLRSCLWT